MEASERKALIRQNVIQHLTMLGKLVLIALVIPFLLSYLIVGSVDFVTPFGAFGGPILLLFAVYFWHIRGYRHILHIPPIGSYQEVITSNLSMGEIAEKMPAVFRFKRYEDTPGELKFLVYPKGLTWSEYVSIRPLTSEGPLFQYEVTSKSPGALKFLKLYLDGGRNYHNVQKVKEVLK